MSFHDALSNAWDDLSSIVNMEGGSTNSSKIDELMDMAGLSFKLDFTYGPEVSIAIAVFLIIVGVLLLFFGTRLFKAALFVCALIGFGALGFFVVVVLTHEKLPALGAGVAIGLIVGVLVLKVWTLALFLVGAGAGFTIWVTFKALLPSLIISQYVEYGVLGALALVLGITAVKLEKLWLLFATPLIGAFFISQGAGFFKHDLNVFSIVAFKEGCHDDTCLGVYAAVFGMCLLGFLVQWRFTSHYASKRRRRARRGKSKHHLRMDSLKDKRKTSGSRSSRASRRRSSSSSESDSDFSDYYSDSEVIDEAPRRKSRHSSRSSKTRGVRVVVVRK